MANSKSSLGLITFLVNITQPQYDNLMSMLNIDNDLTENEEYFREDTLSLGYESEADRIIKEKLSEHASSEPNKESYVKIITEVSEAISDQEYYGSTTLSIVDVNDEEFFVAFAYGGN